MTGGIEPTSDAGFPTLHYTISKQSLHIGLLLKQQNTVFQKGPCDFSRLKDRLPS